jgi:hypothetical protein
VELELKQIVFGAPVTITVKPLYKKLLDRYYAAHLKHKIRLQICYIVDHALEQSVTSQCEERDGPRNFDFCIIA